MNQILQIVALDLISLNLPKELRLLHSWERGVFKLVNEEDQDVTGEMQLSPYYRLAERTLVNAD